MRVTVDWQFLAKKFPTIHVKVVAQLEARGELQKITTDVDLMDNLRKAQEYVVCAIRDNQIYFTLRQSDGAVEKCEIENVHFAEGTNEPTVFYKFSEDYDLEAK